MSSPVTNSQLEAALAKHPTREELEAALAKHPTHEDLDERLGRWGRALLEEMDRRFHAADKRAVASEQRLLAEMARHANAILEPVSAQVSVVDEKYRDLPPRVERLERLTSKRARR